MKTPITDRNAHPVFLNNIVGKWNKSFVKEDVSKKKKKLGDVGQDVVFPLFVLLRDVAKPA